MMVFKQIPVLSLLVAPLSVSANEAAIEIQKVPDVMGAGNILQVVAGLSVVLLMILGAGWMMKRFGGLGGISNANLKVVAGITVGQREKIVVVQAGDVQVLVGISPGNIRTLHVLENNLSNENDLKANGNNASGDGKGFLSHLKHQVEKRAES